jgi:transcriptional regulator with XRE-family HTH domain
MVVKRRKRPQTFGGLIRSLRKAKNLGLVELAKASGFDPGLLSRIETGKRLPPDIPGLLSLAKALGIPEESHQFGVLLVAADRDRNPALHEMAVAMHGTEVWNPFSADMMNEEEQVFCNTFAELVSKAIEKAIRTNAEEISVRSASGAIQKFQLIWEQRKSRKRQ